MADPKTTGTDTTGNPTQASYNAEAVRVSETGTGTATHAHKDNSAKKGLIVGILTFLGLALIDWLVGPAASELESLTLGETLIYAIVGVVVGVIVKYIDKSRQKKAHGV